MLSKVIFSFLLFPALTAISVTPSKTVEKGDLIYFGIEDSEIGFSSCWRVLDPNKTNMGTSGALLYCETLISKEGGKGIPFRLEENPSINTYQGSYAKSWCEEFYLSHFSEEEKKSILPTYKDDPAFAIKAGFSKGEGSPMVNFDAEEGALDGDHVFLLSAEECSNPDYGLDSEESRVAGLMGTAQSYWLRSPHDKSFPNDVGMVFYNGWLMDFIQNTDNVFGTGPTCMRPALNLAIEAASLESMGEGKWKLSSSPKKEEYPDPKKPSDNIMPNVMLGLLIGGVVLFLAIAIALPIILVRHHKKKKRKKLAS